MGFIVGRFDEKVASLYAKRLFARGSLRKLARLPPSSTAGIF
jgi:hypothetical protein